MVISNFDFLPMVSYVYPHGNSHFYAARYWLSHSGNIFYPDIKCQIQL
jgi:hypothetical protein